MICKICGSDLVTLTSYTNQPKTAQFLPTNESIAKNESIRFDVCQCVSCGIVQIPLNPVYYYDTAISSDPWSTDEFREIQLKSFIERFSLQNKKIKKVNEEPKEEKYDAFLMFNYLEHFPDPLKILKQLYNNLPESGVGIIEVPNFDDIIKERIFGEFIIDHLFYFTESGLRLVCELSGFEVLRICSVWEGASLSATVKKRTVLDITPFKQNEKELIDDIDAFIDNYNSVAIWGAGHQTLMMLTMLKNTDKISYIVDDFEPKQNTYTYVKAKKIVPHKQLKENPVDAVIIIVGWQYKHVFNHIKNNEYKFDIALIKKASLETWRRNE